MKEHIEKIRNRWAPRGNIELFHQLVKRRGVAIEEMSSRELAALDQLHSGTQEATELVATWANVEEGDLVLDVGAGLGGTARYLARELSCEVTALEVIPELVECGQQITQWLGLEELVEHSEGDILEFEDEARYDVVLLQHVDMHIEHKVEAYQRCRRVLTPELSSRVVWHDWLAGPEGDGQIVLPVPWAHEGDDITFLCDVDSFRQNLIAAGLALHRIQALTAETAAWFTSSREQLIRVLSKVEGGARNRLEELLEEVEGVLTNLSQRRIVPMLAEARPVE